MKIIKRIISILMMTIISVQICSSKVFAEDETTKIELYANQTCPVYIQYKGQNEVTPYVQNVDSGTTYPAYRLGSLMQEGFAVGEKCTVEATELKDIDKWRIIINGYPYKSASSLGCENAKELFVATENALNLAINPERKIEDYTAVGEEGERVLSAMKKIYENAQKETEAFSEGKIEIHSIEDEWKQDEKDNNYISKKYQMNIGCKILSSCKVSLEKEESDLPAGIKIVNENNEQKSNFKQDEVFKIMMPISSLESIGKFKIKVSAKGEVKRMKVSKETEKCKQSYIVVREKYEQMSGEYQETYPNNATKLVIQEQDLETNEKLKGVQFDILDGENHIVYGGLETDDEGKIEITNILPGKYHIKETKPLDGYMPVEEETEIELKFNEEAIVKISTKKIPDSASENKGQDSEPELQETPPTGQEEVDRKQEQNGNDKEKELTQKPQITVEKIKHNIGEKATENEIKAEKTKKLPITGK